MIKFALSVFYVSWLIIIGLPLWLFLKKKNAIEIEKQQLICYVSVWIVSVAICLLSLLCLIMAML